MTGVLLVSLCGMAVGEVCVGFSLGLCVCLCLWTNGVRQHLWVILCLCDYGIYITPPSGGEGSVS